MSLQDQNSSGYLSGLLLSPQYPIFFLSQLGYNGSDLSQLGLQVLPVSQYLWSKKSTEDYWSCICVPHVHDSVLVAGSKESSLISALQLHQSIFLALIRVHSV
jgi:hypothetical protein